METGRCPRLHSRDPHDQSNTSPGLAVIRILAAGATDACIQARPFTQNPRAGCASIIVIASFPPLPFNFWHSLPLSHARCPWAC